jgi:hypothetical protein
MTDTPDRTESVFAAERAAYLDQACAGDVALRDHVEALLRAHERAGHLLDQPAPGHPELTAAYISDQQPGVVIAGRYKLLEEIGEGGMGSIWVAEQTEPVRRKVALKLIKAGMDSKAVLARFEAERPALAVMDHPNIAKVLDGGLTETGRPFFVMEYVKGVPITEYCDVARLSVPERLNLFVQVCSTNKTSQQIATSNNTLQGQIAASNTQLQKEIADSNSKLQPEIAESTMKLQQDLAREAVRAQQSAHIQGLVLKMIEICIEHPHLEKKDFCHSYPNCSGHPNGKERYESYCCFVFNVLMTIFKHFEQDAQKTRDYIHVEELVRLHYKWWFADKDNLEYDEPFRQFIQACSR